MSDNIEKIINDIDNVDNEIYELQQTIADKLKTLQEKKASLEESLNEISFSQALSALHNKPYGCGTHNIQTQRHTVKVVVSKKVKWDEARLHVIKDQIKEAGKNPADFIKEKLSVAETAYKSFPNEIKKVFDSARSVEQSKPKLTIERN